MRREPEWLISPDLPQGARSSLTVLSTQRLSPEVLELLAKFMKELQAIEKKGTPPVDPCPKLTQCIDYHRPCPELTYCGTFSVKAF